MFLLCFLLFARLGVIKSHLYFPHYRDSGAEHCPDIGNRMGHVSTIESSFCQNLQNFIKGNFDWFKTLENNSSKKTITMKDLHPEDSNTSRTNIHPIQEIADFLDPARNPKFILSTQVLQLKKLGAFSTDSTVDGTREMIKPSQPVKKLRNIFPASASRSNKSSLMTTYGVPTEETPYSSRIPGNLPTEEIEFKKSFSSEATVNLSIQTVECSGILQKFRAMLPSNVTRSTDGRMLRCPYGIKICLSLCCPMGEVLTGNKCFKDNVDFDHMMQVHISICTNDSKDGHAFINDDYVHDWMASRDIQNFSLTEYGLLYAPDLLKGWLLGPENYCLFRESGSSRYLAKVWSPEARKSVWDTFCCICIILIMIVILICYNIVPELKNLHGVIFQSYVATDIASYVCVLGLEITSGSETYSNVYTIFKNIAYYTGCSCAIWLNVMSIAIWRTFQSFRYIDHNLKKREKKRFIWYAIYAWGTPAALVLTCVAVIHYEPDTKDIYGRTLTWWTNLVISIITFICNIFLYIWTAFTIRQLKKDTAHLADGVNKHREVAKQWLNMYVKLFVIMTGPMGGGIIPLILWLVWPIPLITGLLYGVQLVQSILTLYVSLWKDSIKRSLRDQFNATFRRLHDLVEKSESTSSVESRTNSTMKH